MNRRSAADSKQKILNAAINVFSEHGYDGTSMRMIAGKAGISVGGLYLYHENKESLYSTLMEKVLEDVSREMEEAIEKIPDPVTAMRTLIHMRLQYARKNKELIIANTREHKFALRDDVRTRFFERQRRLIQRTLERGIVSGDFAPCDVGEATKVIMGVVRGFVFSFVVDTDNRFSGEECSRLLLDGLRSRDDGERAR
jgi:AcrR family transcriptional regulator